ncbi:asparagine synthase (glutamine-hydrolyzing) [Muriicola sp. Z0-33]|uniref:asparagine synthase (glutamine-hydrolyzing) n=1 Tax=Muriicola sp. Z0-33 TaxID=2816957 RepID=UPI0022388524|nr:asparagine synthase (glutamine-hydrolyzing) [Muriicola sp. Z0-33]MCW5517986.1 asparagine synthase (glutamine-hydrolyzing) [Muriicola sp. Z0-33]
MCGINGAIALSKQKTLNWQADMRPTIEIMNNTIEHRGPDSDGVFIKEPIAFGFRRLSIIDLDDSANQPMLSSDKNIVLVFNGEIYNYLEIKSELIEKGYRFRTASDTEVIINSYLEYGEECVQHFNGMWAFAIYDFRKNKLFCSRDRLGVKPFYYCYSDNCLFFSSELKVLHKVCNLRDANHSKVFEYLAYGYRLNDGETFFKACSELLPGTNMVYENDKFSFFKYWKLEENSFKHNPILSPHEEYIQLFENAVKLRYRSDVPVALLLSGGLDSSAIAKVTDNLIEKGELEQTDIHAYIASFPNFKDDETAIAREFIKTCRHIKLHEILIDKSNLISDFENIIYNLDHPLGSFTSIAHHNIMKECKQRGIKVVLNGQGSDEAYAGYDRYISGAHLLNQLLSSGGNFAKEFRALNSLNNYSKSFLISQMIKSILNQPFASYLRAKYQEKSISCLNNDFINSNYKHYQSEYKFSFKGNNFNNYLLNDINHKGRLNHILHYEDISSMQQSIEIRSPFMDYRMLEFAFSIPTELKFKNGVTKIIQRDTIGKLLPDSIKLNRNKIGFNTPFNEYISNDPIFKSYIFDILNAANFKSKKIWNSDKILKVFENPTKYPNFPFWRIINLEVWSKVYNINNL